MTGHATGSLVLAAEPPQHFTHLDEDVVTLCVDAARAALTRANVRPADIRHVEIGDGEPPTWSDHVRLALGVTHATLRRATADDAALAQPGLLRIEFDAMPGLAGRASSARATLEGIRPRDPPSKDVPPVRRTVDRAFLDRVHAAEARCLAQVPMGAYVPRATWDASLEARYRLLVSRCAHCEQSSHPPFATCPRCGRPTTITPHLEGTIHTFTTIAKGAGPTEFDEWQALDGDYVVAIVDLAPGVRVAGMMTSVDPTTVKIGQRVRAVFRRLYAQEGAWRYGTKFASLDETPGR